MEKRKLFTGLAGILTATALVGCGARDSADYAELPSFPRSENPYKSPYKHIDRDASSVASRKPTEDDLARLKTKGEEREEEIRASVEENWRSYAKIMHKVFDPTTEEEFKEFEGNVNEDIYETDAYKESKEYAASEFMPYFVLAYEDLNPDGKLPYEKFDLESRTYIGEDGKRHSNLRVMYNILGLCEEILEEREKAN